MPKQVAVPYGVTEKVFSKHNSGKRIYQGSALIKTLDNDKIQRIGLNVPANIRNAIIDIANNQDTTFTNAVVSMLKLGIKQYQRKKTPKNL